MGTNRSHAHMLNENVYSKLMADRERVRNKFIDTMGRKPLEDEIDAVRIKSDALAQNYEQSPRPKSQRPAPRY